MELDLKMDENIDSLLSFINSLPMGTPIQFKLPNAQSVAKQNKIKNLFNFLIPRIKVGIPIEISYLLQPPVAKIIAKRLPVGGELRLISPMPVAAAVSIVTHLRLGCILELNAISIKAAQIIVKALRPGTILKISSDIDEDIAESTVSALPEGCTLRIFENISIALSQKLIYKMKPYQVLSLSGMIDVSIMIEMAKLLSPGCALQLPYDCLPEMAVLVIQHLKPGCILKIDSLMDLILIQKMISFLSPRCAISFPVFTEEELPKAVKIVQYLNPGHVLRIPPSMNQNIACILVKFLPKKCILELSALMLDDIVILILKILPPNCIFKLPDELPPQRIKSWIQALPDTCFLDLPVDISKPLECMLQEVKYEKDKNSLINLKFSTYQTYQNNYPEYLINFWKHKSTHSRQDSKQLFKDNKNHTEGNKNKK